MKTIPIPSDLFVSNRNRLREKLPPKSLAVIVSNDSLPTNADGTLGFHQNADLFYLSGINQEKSILVLAPDAFDDKSREILFLQEGTEHSAIWEGHRLTKEEAKARSGVANVEWLPEFRSRLHRLMVESDFVFLNLNEHTGAPFDFVSQEKRFALECQSQYPLHEYRRLAPLLAELRLLKSTFELDVLKKACGLTRDGFLRVLKTTSAGKNEAEIEAEFAHEFIRNQATFAYPPIVAAGANNCILHYVDNNQPLKSGDLLLLDVGAGYGQYNADMTRTIPIQGRFTDRQRNVYDAVLRVFRAVVGEMRPGKTTKDLRLLTESLIEKELVDLKLLTLEDIQNQNPDKPLFKKYFMHGVAHPLGLDVHDVGAASATIQPGWVLTCEPGIYIRDEGFGVRLENDILIGETSNMDLMEDIPIEADEIEALMKRSP